MFDAAFDDPWKFNEWNKCTFCEKKLTGVGLFIFTYWLKSNQEDNFPLNHLWRIYHGFVL